MKAKQLRDSILQMAIQGKLVPQDPNDEPASELLKKIKVEKEQLIKAKKIKKDKNESFIFRGTDGLFYETIGTETKCIQDEIPFEIPGSWEWCRLRNISLQIIAGRDKPKDIVEKQDNNHMIPVIANGITNHGIIGYTSKSSISSIMSNSITVAGRGTIGYSELRDYEYLPIVRLIVIQQSRNIIATYLLNALRSLSFKSLGTSIPQLTIPMIAPKLLPIPPLAEQKRIVEKLEKLLPLVEDYGKNEEALSKLQQEFPNRLRKSILQEAIQGKLVPQDPNDEPASKLLKKIKAEKEQLIKAKKIKKDKNEPFIFRGTDGLFYETIGTETKCIQDEIPFEIPGSWEWCRLRNVVYARGQKIPQNRISYIDISSIDEFAPKNHKN